MQLYRDLLKSLEAGQASAVALIVESRSNRVRAGQKVVLFPSNRVVSSVEDPDVESAAVSLARRALSHKGYVSEWVLPPAPEGSGPQPGGWRIFAEAILPPPAVAIFGGGHIAVPLARLARLLDYQVTVFDDRPSFANPARFPGAAVVCADFETGLDRVEISPSTYVVLVTRGHRQDELCLRKVVGSSAAYIGMIGSRRRVRGVLARMSEDGYPEEQVGRVHAPIGLDIGAQTPGEIALAIMAEITLVRHGGSGRPLSLVEPTPSSGSRPAELGSKNQGGSSSAESGLNLEMTRRLAETVEAGGSAALATIIETRGPTPRKPGAQMIILADGQAFGTIGGGCGESEVRREALEVLRTGESRLYTVDLTADFAADEGMVCGGTMEVFIERL